jgi:DNA-directed RNA polymerase specialized sigma24 family protein
VASIDELFAALCRLRDAARGGARDRQREQSDWRAVDAWLRRQRAARESEDAVQEALLSIARRVGELDARDAPSAAAWLSRIVKHKRIDEARQRAREGKRVEPIGDELPTDSIARDDAWQLDDDALARLIHVVEEAITTHVATLGLPAGDAMLRRMQARATLQRVLGATQAELRATLAIDDAIGDARVHKWIERGRPLLVRSLDRVEADPDEPLHALIDRLREVALERRIDAGIARPGRRKSAGESVE